MKLFFAYSIVVLTVLVFGGCDNKGSNEGASNNVQQKIVVTEGEMDIREGSPLVTYDMNGNEKFSVAIDKEETALTRKIGALASVKNNYSTINKELLEKRLSKNYILKCSSCHDDYANGVVGPSLLTKSTNDIYEMIYAYKTATKVNILMKYLVSQMGEKEITNLAQEISNFNKEYRKDNENKTDN